MTESAISCLCSRESSDRFSASTASRSEIELANPVIVLERHRERIDQLPCESLVLRGESTRGTGNQNQNPEEPLGATQGGDQHMTS